ncbi:hypothetical protein Purlil1_12010 [Purpureocillium lilacinum]|uniref:Secreted protein n=1 Tax=Purpureocillium lilacinum TaxID=33203 RepID=A0ABR0BI67_PURLI|nr:hypothetical protein Purlil1_12010 [Purpureocillium lilacinum]
MVVVVVVVLEVVACICIAPVWAGHPISVGVAAMQASSSSFGTALLRFLRTGGGPGHRSPDTGTRRWFGRARAVRVGGWWHACLVSACACVCVCICACGLRPAPGWSHSVSLAPFTMTPSPPFFTKQLAKSQDAVLGACAIHALRSTVCACVDAWLIHLHRRRRRGRPGLHDTHIIHPCRSMPPPPSPPHASQPAIPPPTRQPVLAQAANNPFAMGNGRTTTPQPERKETRSEELALCRTHEYEG